MTTRGLQMMFRDECCRPEHSNPSRALAYSGVKASAILRAETGSRGEANYASLLARLVSRPAGLNFRSPETKSEGRQVLVKSL